jgi:C-5 cytosine-specific DNA methylase
LRKSLAVDLFTGLGGWTEGLIAEGFDVIGFDIERHVYGDHQYPAQLVLQDVLTLHGKQFKDVDLIVASPPCQEYSYMAMPWSRAKKIQAEYLDGTRNVKDLTRLFDACFRIQREACEAAGRHIPMVVENVRGAEKWVGRAAAKYGSFYLWGDVPALMPITKIVPKRAMDDLSNGQRKLAHAHLPIGDGPGGRKAGGTWFDKNGYNPMQDGVDGHKNARNWWSDGAGSLSATTSSKSNARKAASAIIAKIPLPLSRWIAHAWKPS